MDRRRDTSVGAIFMTQIDSCEALLAAMVGFDTVNANISGRSFPERPLAEYLETQARAAGLATERFSLGDERFNLVIRHEVDRDAPWLLFESHLDTVSVDGMTIDPFVAEIEGGHMYGRGTCDTKGSGAAMLWALKQYAASDRKRNNVAIACTLDEEIGKTGAAAFAREHLGRLGWRPKGVIVGEPTMLEPVVAHNGVARWRMLTRGVAAHSADPSKGVSAISRMTRVIDAIESVYIPQLDAEHPLTGKAQCSINIIRGGVQINIIPESCEVHVDRRVVPGEDPATVLPAVQRVLDTLRQSHPDLEVVCDQVFLDPPLDPAGSEAFITFVRGVLAGMGLSDDVIGVGYATDASNFRTAGVPAVVLGPGDIAQAHTCDEWIELEQLHRAVEVYLNLMLQPMEGA